MSSYVEPEWAHKPSREWILTEIKGGMELAKHDLQGRPTTILGRALDMVHIPLNHDSASRQHARISFDRQGIPWLRDLRSTHGTKCNKKPLPPQVCGKLETNSSKPGSRGIMVYPGDIFQFGASTRIFTLDGPPEFERGAMKAKLANGATTSGNSRNANMGDSAVPSEKSKERDQEVEGVSWGMSMDDGIESDQDSSYTNKTLPMDMQVPEKHRKSFDRLNSLKYKLSNLEAEDGRIKRKCDLTSGQEKQLQRNAEREEALKQSISQLEEELYDKLYPEKAHIRKSTTRGEDVSDDDVDDFFDRTKQENEEDVIGEEESEQSLVEKWKNLCKLRSEVQANHLFPAQQKVQEIQQKLATLRARNDEDAFFVQNDLSLAKETRNKALAKQESAAQKMEEIEKLLRVVNPKLHVDRESGYIGERPLLPKEEFVAPAPIQAVLPPPVRQIPTMGNSTKSNNDSDSMAMPPPVLLPTRIRSPISPSRSPFLPSRNETKRGANNSNSNTKTVMPPPMMPPPKKARVVGPSLRPSASIERESKNGSNNPKKPLGTLAFLASVTKGTKSSSGQKGGKEKEAEKKDVLDPKKDVWRAPEGQDGSGYTKLNAKFAGRY